MKESLKRVVKNSKVLNFFPRVLYASSYYNQRYLQILKWGITSNEDTNFTFPLTEKNLKVLAQTIAIITDKPYEAIYAYIQEILNDQEFKSFIIDKIKSSDYKSVADERTDLHKRVGWYAFARVLKPKVIVETGIDKGLGAVTLCAALLRNKEEGYEGKYYGTDINRKAGYLLDGKYKSSGEILYGDSIASLKALDEQIDLFVNDSDHSAEYEYNEYKTILSKLSPNAVILGDNSHVTDKLLNFSIENGRKYLFFSEEPLNHWYPGGGIGISFK